MLTIETLTLNELTRRLRALGVSTSEVKVGNAIERGLYPFAICIPGEQKRSFEIYTRLFEEWVAERATQAEPSRDGGAA